MNVKRTSSLQTLAALAQICARCGIEMQPTEEGFMLRRYGMDNHQLRKTLMKVASRRDDVRFLIGHAWGCGENCDLGLHVMDV